MICVTRKHPGIEVEADWEELQDPFISVLRELGYSDDWKIRHLLKASPAIVEDSLEIDGKKLRVKFILTGSSATCRFDASADASDKPYAFALEAFNRSLRHLLEKAIKPYVEAARIFSIIIADLSHLVEGKVKGVLRSDLKALASDIFEAIEPLLERKIAEFVKQENHKEEATVR